jgi:hypothetical protein
VSDKVIPLLAETSSDVKLANPGLAPILVQVGPWPATGPGLPPFLVVLAPGETRFLADAAGGILDPDTESAFRVQVVQGSLLVSTRAGAVSPPAGPGGRLALTPLVNDGRFGSGIELVETSGFATDARLTLYDGNGSVLGVHDVALGAGEVAHMPDVHAYEQGAERASAVLEVLRGGSIGAAVMRVDAASGEVMRHAGIPLR